MPFSFWVLGARAEAALGFKPTLDVDEQEAESRRRADI